MDLRLFSILVNYSSSCVTVSIFHPCHNVIPQCLSWNSFCYVISNSVLPTGLVDLHLIPKKRCTSLSGVNSYIFFSCTSRIRPHCYFYEKHANTIFL